MAKASFEGTIQGPRSSEAKYVFDLTNFVCIGFLDYLFVLSSVEATIDLHT